MQNMETTAFPGFAPETVQFLKALKTNNSREWFTANKKTYEQVYKRPAKAFSGAMAAELEQLTGIPHASKIFRVNRDLRFAKDKTPYNTHLHISFIPHSDLATPPCWFFGLDTGSLALGAGVFGFDKTMLEVFRNRIDSKDGDLLQSHLSTLRSNGVRISDPDLQRVPSGYPKDHRHADLLRHKGVSAWIDFEDTDAAIGDSVVDTCLNGFKRLWPVFDWLLEMKAA